ncbi:MAG: CRTAC1 family protein [Phycisphaerales bacterium]|nr:CRTAC1 family protein [Phycisphaerales bacterium]
MGSKSPLFLSLTILLFGGSVAKAGPAYTDVTATAGINFTVNYGGTFSGLSSVQAMMQRNMGNGAAVGDYDGDGDLDIYLLGQLGMSNRLYRNNLNMGMKTFTDVTAIAGVDDLGMSRVAHFVDLDNDGYLDLVLVNDDDGTGHPSSKIFRNDGHGTFTDVSATANFQSIGYLRCGAALADYDQDGLLDIYVTNWGLELGTGPAVFPGSNRLYRNLGNFTFSDVTTTSANLGTLARDSFSAIFFDFNDDFFPDIYVAVDHTTDEFYWNNNGVFSLATGAVGATHVGNDMGAACADFDDDGDLDIYTTNITDPEGPFGTTQFNCLYLNQFDTVAATQFTDEAIARGVEDTYWGWGVEFTDVENDGDLDIVAVNGFDEFVAFADSTSSPIYQTPTVLLVNDATGHFTRVLAPGLEATDDSRALIAFDYDRDGDEDLLITNIEQPVRLLENVSTPGGHWLDVQLVQGAGANRNAIGASVYATIGSTTKRRDIISGDSYLAGTPLEAHFGLGADDAVEQLRVRWTDGSEAIFEDVAVDRMVTISNVPGDCDANTLVEAGDLEGFVAVLLDLADAPLCIADLNGDGKTDAADIQPFVDELFGS